MVRQVIFGSEIGVRNVRNAVGVVECKSIPRGMLLADNMVKTASVDLLTARPICPGRYIILIGGDVGTVQAAMDLVSQVDDVVVAQSFIAGIDKAVFSAIRGNTAVSKRQALGIVETSNIPSCIKAADAAVKAANIELIRLRIGGGLGGKAFVMFTGDVAAAGAAVDAARTACEAALIEGIVISAPHADLWETLGG